MPFHKYYEFAGKVHNTLYASRPYCSARSKNTNKCETKLIADLFENPDVKLPVIFNNLISQGFCKLESALQATDKFMSIVWR